MILPRFFQKYNFRLTKIAFIFESWKLGILVVLGLRFLQVKSPNIAVTDKVEKQG